MTDQTAHGAVKVEQRHRDAAQLIYARSYLPLKGKRAVDGLIDDDNVIQIIAQFEASLSPTTTDAVRGEVEAVSTFVLEWTAAARPPVHSEPMTGRQGFDTLDKAIAFMSRQAPDAEFKSLTEIITRKVDRSRDVGTLHPSPEDPSGGQDVERRLAMFLEILSAIGGASDASDYHWNWIHAFCEAHEGRDPDTFNLAANRGFTTVSHDSDTDESKVRITDKGREFLGRNAREKA